MSRVMTLCLASFAFFFIHDTATTEIYTLFLHDALPICSWSSWRSWPWRGAAASPRTPTSISGGSRNRLSATRAASRRGLAWRRRRPRLSTHGNGLDLHEQLRSHQPVHDQERVRRIDTVRKILREHLGPGLHEAGDVVGARQERLQANDVAHGAAAGLDDRADVLEGLPGLDA